MEFFNFNEGDNAELGNLQGEEVDTTMTLAENSEDQANRGDTEIHPTPLEVARIVDMERKKKKKVTAEDKEKQRRKQQEEE